MVESITVQNKINIEKNKQKRQEIAIIKKFYSTPTQINMLGPRILFDDSQHRIIFKEKNIVNGFLECKLINNTGEGILNIGLLPRYKYLGFITPIFIDLINQPDFQRTKFIYISIHIEDSQMEQLLIGLKFSRLTDKLAIRRLKLPLDGLHLTYKFITGRK